MAAVESDYYTLEGGASSLAAVRRRSFGAGLVLNQCSVGAVQGALPALIYPLLKRQLKLQGYQANSAQSLLAVSASCKLGFTLLTDALPIRGTRRRPYMAIGWLVVLLTSALLVGMFAYGSTEDRLGNATGTVLLLLAISLGSMLVDAACDGRMVDLTRREDPTASHGSVGVGVGATAHKTVYTARFVSEVASTVLVGLLTNGAEYGGSFSFAVPTCYLFELLMTIAVVGLLATVWGVREDIEESADDGQERALKSAELHRTPIVCRPGKAVDLHGLERVLRSRTTWQLALYGFLQKLFLDLKGSPRLAIHDSWLGTEPLSMSIFLASMSAIYAVASLLAHRVLLTPDCSFRSITLAAVVAGSVVSLPSVVVAATTIVRDQYLVLLSEQISHFFDAVAMMARILVAVEIAEPGSESSTYAVVTACFSLAEPVSSALSNIIGGFFDVFDADIDRDSTQVRWHVVALFATLTALRVIGNVVILPLLPAGQASARELRDRAAGNSVPRFVVPLVGCLLAISVAALVANVLAVVEATACLRFVGGPGC